jgi:NarL family two-component system response regulator YdfI
VIRILVAAASPVVRAGLESMLRGVSNLEVIGSVADSGQWSGQEPDVTVLDWDRDADDPPGDWIGVAPLLLLTNDLQAAWIAEALRGGVRGLLAREAGQSQIIAAVEAVAAGLTVLDADDLEAILVGPKPARITESLTPRETEVLGMLAEGLSNKMVAHRLGISEHTVKFHVQSIMAKLDAGSRTEAVTLGIRQGLILL